MDSKYKTTSKVENFFSMLLTKAAISDNLFIGNMPATVESNWKEMVLVDVLSMKDYGAMPKVLPTCSCTQNQLTVTARSP